MISVRLLGPSDAEPMARVRRRAYETDPVAFAGTLESDPTCDATAVRAKLATQSFESGSVVLGAFSPALVGLLGLVREEPGKLVHKGRLWGFYVEPEARGAGIGRALLTEAMATARRMGGLEQLTLRVGVSCAAAISLYTAFGFEPFGREPRALKSGASYLDELHMVAFLEKPAD